MQNATYDQKTAAMPDEPGRGGSSFKKPETKTNPAIYNNMFIGSSR
jgi:hypothetical protein